MKHICLMALGAILCMAQGAVAETVSRTFYIDFGDVKEGRGHVTEGPDANGHYWNNVKSSGNNYIYPGTKVQLVTADNVATDCDIMVNVRFMTNGMSAGGLNTPDAALLGDLAVQTATEDYLFVENFQDYNFFTFHGLDQQKSYRFHAFGSRANDQVRIGNYSFRGLNEWNEDHQMSGPGCGANGYNGNNNHISVSDPIFPDENGCITFTIKRVSNMTHINAMKVEEIADGEARPDNFTLRQSVYVDFGESKTAGGRDHGHETTGTDANGHYWNNIVCTSGDQIPSGTTCALVNSANEPSGFTARTLQYLKTNGTSANGGLENPRAEYLHDLAIPTATEDYFYVEVSQKNAGIEFSGLDKDKAYRVSAFGSRATNETGDRWAYFHVVGKTTWTTRQDFSGRGIGGRYNEDGKDYHGNTMNVAVSDFIFPDADGKIVFNIEQKTGLAHLNVLKIEEYDVKSVPVREPDIMSLALTGDAVEAGGDMPMRALSPGGGYTGRFICFARLNEGTYSFAGLTDEDASVTLGDKDGKLQSGGAPYTVGTPGVYRIIADTRSHTVELTLLNALNVKGPVVPAAGATLEYAGRGVWKSSVKLVDNNVIQYINRYIWFAFNNDDNLAVKRVAGTNEAVMPSLGFNGENIRINGGEYEITLDMAQGTFDITADVNPYKVSIFGSSVANGQGADGFQGYAYLYGEQLKNRHTDGDSEYPLFTSGVAIGGNTTTNLLNRYDDLLRDFGHYVMIGLSLGNEGIHGAGDPERVFGGFRDNMLTLIAKMRADGKEPVVVNNYTRGDYNDADYSYVKRMNLLIHEWDVPSVNVLGAIDDGAGHWSTGYIADSAHPNGQGHKEFFYAIVPSLFDALIQGKPLPERDLTPSYTLADGQTISFTGEETVHPFTLVLRVKGNAEGQLFKFVHGPRKNFTGSVNVNADGSLTYNSPQKDAVTTGAVLTDNEWHDVALTHYYARGYTALYVDGVLKASVSEKLVPSLFTIGDEIKTVSREISEVSFWRSGMNEQEIAAQHSGKMMKSSLEIYAPMDVTENSVANKAQSLNGLTLSEISGSAIENVAASGSEVTAAGGHGTITLNGPEGTSVAVYAADGRLCAKVTLGDTPVEVAAAPGVYVAAGIKVVVR